MSTLRTNPHWLVKSLSYDSAVKAAMAFLNNGAECLDAVEVAIRVLEDKEITNAGFGANLTMEGNVECDATIVDQYGRSGAVGAVPSMLHMTYPGAMIDLAQGFATL